MIAPAARQVRPVSSSMRMIFERIERCHMMKFRIRDDYTHWTGKGSFNPSALIGAENFYQSRLHLTQVGEATGNLRTLCLHPFSTSFKKRSIPTTGPVLL